MNTTGLTVQSPFYFPLQSGRYEVKPGLFRFPHDFNNGVVDEKVFQFDGLFDRYRAVKLAAREERLGKYYCKHRPTEPVPRQLSQFLIETLCRQAPEYFELSQHDKLIQLHCKLTGETLLLDEDYQLRDTRGLRHETGYQDILDAIACQLQEDLALIKLDDSGHELISHLHLCFPNHWSAEAKIGRGFIRAHVPVPEMERINRHIDKLIPALIYKGPYVRFAWGIATDTRLNHHPVAAAGVSQQEWQGRMFDPLNPALYLRVERQTLNGLPKLRSVLFTIRTYFYDITQLIKNTEHKAMLISAIHSMTDDELMYKGLKEDKTNILSWLHNT